MGEVGERARRDQRAPGEADREGQQERPGTSRRRGEGARRAGPRGRIRQQPGRFAERGLRRLPEGERHPGPGRERLHPRPLGFESHVLPGGAHRDPGYQRDHRNDEEAGLQEHRFPRVRRSTAVRTRQHVDQEPLAKGGARLRVRRPGQFDGARLHGKLPGGQGCRREVAGAVDRDGRPGKQDRG